MPSPSIPADFALLWPWIGLGSAGTLLLLLWGTTALQRRPGPRTRDIAWLTWLAVAAYMLHQFEEHGIDLLDRPYAFRDALCLTLGLGSGSACPVPTAFITAVNVAAVWLAGPTSALLGQARPLVALGFFSVPLVNAAVHLAPVFMGRGYNPGALTAALLFVPLSGWAMRIALAHGHGWRAVLLVVALGIALHAVLMGSLMAYLHGMFGLAMLVAIQVVNAFIPVAVTWAASRGHAAGDRRGWNP